jgi:hypothetical protein
MSESERAAPGEGSPPESSDDLLAGKINSFHTSIANEPQATDHDTGARGTRGNQAAQAARARTRPHEVSPRRRRHGRSGVGQGGSGLLAQLAWMNKQYAVVQIGGKTRVMGFEADPSYPRCQVPVFQTFADFRAFHQKHKVEVKDANGNLKTKGRGHWWLESRFRRQYGAVVYAPNVNTGADVYNLWQGFAYKPKEGDCSLYLEHMRDNICRGNEEHYHYLLNMLAYGVQHPEKQGEVAVVLRGKEGVGKGLFVRTYGSLFGSHFKHISNPRHLVGNFNSLQHDCSVLFGDEVFLAGDRAHEGILKAIITEPTLQIERKGIDTFTAPNRMHVFLSSNSDWVVPAGADARRFFVLDVGDSHKQDHRYFKAMIQRWRTAAERRCCTRCSIAR